MLARRPSPAERAALALLVALVAVATGCQQAAKRVPVTEVSEESEASADDATPPRQREAREAGGDDADADEGAQAGAETEPHTEAEAGRAASPDDEAVGTTMRGASDGERQDARRAPPPPPPAAASARGTSAPASRERGSEQGTSFGAGSAGSAGAIAVGRIPSDAESAADPTTPTRQNDPPAEVSDDPEPLDDSDGPERERASNARDDAAPEDDAPRPRAEADGPAEPSVIWALRSPPVEEGTPLSIPVMISSAHELRSVPFHLRFDPALLRFERVEAGALLASSGSPTILASEIGPGRVAVGLSFVAGAGELAGEGELARIVFTTLAPGAGLVGFENARAIGPGLATVEARFVGTGYTITSVTPGLERP